MNSHDAPEPEPLAAVLVTALAYRVRDVTPDTGPGRVMLWVIGSWIVAALVGVAVWRAL